MTPAPPVLGSEPCVFSSPRGGKMVGSMACAACCARFYAPDLTDQNPSMQSLCREFNLISIHYLNPISIYMYI